MSFTTSLRSGLLFVTLSLVVGCEAHDRVAERRVDGAVQSLLPVQENLNILVVSFDALRPDVLGAYGGARNATPNMDEFAEESLVFTNAYSVAPVTPTSFAAAFTGFLPTRVFHAWKLRGPGTLAGRLSDAGYHTAAFVNNVQLAPERGFDRGFDHYVWSRNDADEKVLAKAKEWLEDTSQFPVFLWLHFLTPHAPYQARPEASHLYRTEPSGRFSKSTGHKFEATGSEELSRIEDLYLGEVWRADRLFGDFVSHLRRIGLWDTSIVVLTSDHGEELGEHGGFQHGRLYEEHLRIPFIVHHPVMDRPRRLEGRVRNVDFLPTFLHAAGHPVRDVLDGRVLTESSSPTAPPLVAISMTGAEKRWVSITEGSRKLIVACGPERRAELYDLQVDPAEQADLAREQPTVVRELLTTLRTILGGAPCDVLREAARGRAPTAGLDDESIEALRALGYLD